MKLDNSKNDCGASVESYSDEDEILDHTDVYANLITQRLKISLISPASRIILDNRTASNSDEYPCKQSSTRSSHRILLDVELGVKTG